MSEPKTTEEKIRICISYLQKHGYQVILPKFGKKSAEVHRLVESQREQMLKMGGASVASLLSTADVCALIGVSSWTLKRWVAADKFPKPVMGGGVFGSSVSTLRWRLCDVQAFVQAKTQPEVA